MNQYTWSFPALEAYPQHAGEIDVVFTIHWRLTGDDGNGHSATVYGTVSVQYNEGDPFTPYASLTPELVQSWVEEDLGSEQVVAMKANIDSQIANQINPPSVTLPPPWEKLAEPVQAS